jgi:hypothetical protein
LLLPPRLHQQRLAQKLAQRHALELLRSRCWLLWHQRRQRRLGTSSCQCSKSVFGYLWSGCEHGQGVVLLGIGLHQGEVLWRQARQAAGLRAAAVMKNKAAAAGTGAWSKGGGRAGCAWEQAASQADAVRTRGLDTQTCMQVHATHSVAHHCLLGVPVLGAKAASCLHVHVDHTRRARSLRHRR